MIRKLVLSLVAVLSVVAMAVAQNKQVSGRVSGEDGAPIVGATVLVEGSTTSGASTNIAGEFTLRAPVNGNLVISFIGYETQVVAVNGQTNLEIVLKEDTKSIDDVIVVAFGEAKKEAFTGSATVVKSEDIAKVQTTNAINALNGKVSGVQIMNVTGQPGSSSPSILVRGVSSINAGKAPLIVLDGMPYDGDMDSINPNDIESMTVLKDAASNALYGARGANGVIMITTKRAKSRDAVVNVDIKVGVNSRATQDYDYITDPGEYYETHYKALYNYYKYRGQDDQTAYVNANKALTGKTDVGGLGYNVFTYPETETLIGSNGKLNPHATLGRMYNFNGEDYWVTPDNWIDEVYGTGVRQEYNASVSASNERTNFYASFGYLNNEGIVDKTDYNRYTARLRADYQAKKWLKVGANISFAHYDSQTTDTSSDGDGASGGSGNIFDYTAKMAPIYPLYVRDGQGNIRVDENGNIVYDYGTSNRAGSNAGLERPVHSGSNGVGAHMLDVHNYNGNTLSLSGFAEVRFLKDFKFVFNGTTYMQESAATDMQNGFYGPYASNGGSLSKTHSRAWAYNLQQLLSWGHTYGKHTVDVMIGHENYVRTAEGLSGNKQKMFSPDMLELPMAIKTISTSSSKANYNNEGYFFRGQYDYDNRVFVSGSYRRDASSKFHPDHRWGNFWSLGAAWLINHESWFNVKWIDMLKIKASYGSQGNDSLGSSYYNLYEDIFSVTEQNGEPSVTMVSKGNENITWETNANFNTGVEFELFHGRLAGSVDYFYRKTSDMLSFFQVPPSMGYSGYYKNIGDMANQGVEIELNGVAIRSKNVQWNINANITYVKNRISYLADENKTGVAFDLDGNAYPGYSGSGRFYGEGLPIYSRYTRAYAGVNRETGESMWYKYNYNSETEEFTLGTTTNYSEASNFVFDSSLPKWYGGFGTTVDFYGFDFTVNFVYQLGGKMYDSDYASAMASPVSGTGYAYHRDILNSWTPENPDTDIPRFQYQDSNSASSSDRFLISSNYLSLQNLTFGYTLPRKLTSKIGLSRVRVYLACDNVWLWSKRQGLDPRQSYTGGASTAYYSPIRTISGGLNLTF